MKNIFIAIAILAFTLAVNLVNASDSLSGNTLTKFGTYQLTPSLKSVVTDNSTYKTWDLSYSGTTEKYKLIVVPGADGKNSYKVVGKDIQIMYNVGSDNSGGNYIEPELLSIPQRDPGRKISHEQLQSQTVNTPSLNSDEYLGLVACFMPRLMN
jgi:hypothetical protein